MNNVKWVRSFALTALLLALGGCGSTSWDDLRGAINGEGAINYKSVVRSDPLSIPPDLTQATSDPRFKPAAGTTTYSQYTQQSAASAAAAGTNTQAAVLPTFSDIQVERSGDKRWLSVAMPPDQVFSKVADFWTDNGFTLENVDPKAGLMTTNWAENRAKIPQDMLRNLLGSILDSLYDSGTRDKFTTRLERNGKRTEIYISHKHMIEQMTGTLSEGAVTWQNGREDPGLNSAMIARLMVYLGEDVDSARKKMALQKTTAASAPVAAAASTSTDKTSLTVSDPFDRAWRRVSVALDSGGFSVEDRDRAAGDFYVRYVDVDTGAKREEPNIIQRLLGTKDTTVAPSYRLHLVSTGSSTEITVFDANGKRDTSATAQRMLAILADKI